MSTNKISEMYPYICVNDGEQAIRFYTEVFGAQETLRLTEPSGKIGHAELKLGSAILMLAEEFKEYGIVAPGGGTETSFTIHLHVENCDAMFDRAIAAGAKAIREPQDQFYGERSCTIQDPFGHQWLLGHSIEEVTPEEMQRRYTALFT